MTHAISQKTPQLKTHKDYVVLILIALAGFCFTLFSFYPGFLNLDSVNQLQQAQGKVPLTDWHPPAMALLWRLLIFLTGNISSLLVLQLLAYWLAFGAIAITIRKQIGSLKLSLLPFVVAILPTSIVITGVYWKDVLMASLLCLVAALLYIGSYTKKKTRPALIIFIVSTILIIYSGTLRHNALPALIPLAYAASFNFFSNNRKTLLATIAIIAMVPISMKITERVFSVQRINFSASVMVDDLKSILTEEEIMASTMAPGTKKYLIEVKRSCNKQGILSYGIFLCSDNNMSGFRYVSRNDYDNIKSTWINSILNKPLDYVKFRLAVFWRFITDSSIIINGLVPNSEKQIDFGFMYFTNDDLDNLPIKDIKNNDRSNFIETYHKLSTKDFGFLYKPYFWLSAGFLLLLYSRSKSSRINTYPSGTIILSGIIYALTYFSFVNAYVFRFIFWTTLSTGIALVVFIVKCNNKSNLR